MDTQSNYNSAVLTALRFLGCDTGKWSGGGFHTLHNVMTLELSIRDFFDKLDLWFEKTDTPDQYQPITSRAGLRRNRGIPKFVTFTSTDPELFPLPSPEFLALHAACAKVAHLSGAAEYIDKHERDLEYMDVLALDGSSSAAFGHRLWQKLGTSMDALQHP